MEYTIVFGTTNPIRLLRFLDKNYCTRKTVKEFQEICEFLVLTLLLCWKKYRAHFGIV